MYANVRLRTSKVLSEFDKKTMETIAGYVVSTPKLDAQNGQMPLGIVVAGSNIADHARLFKNISQHLSTDNATVLLSSKDGSNLRMFLKGIILQVIRTYHDFAREEGDDEIVLTSRGTAKGDRRMNYDLSILEDWTIRFQQPRKVVILIQDADSFDAEILSELIRILQ